jgi:flagellar hook-associated protein 3 FlgL
MRVTNGMISNNMLNSLYTNMTSLNTLFNQMSTLKKIQRPSDDPIVAGRSLKLRIDVLESTQHIANTQEANSWMEVSEAALVNINDLLTEIRTRINQAANGTNGLDDREKIVNDITQLYKQLQQEANVSYAGRYVFSGYKTDQPVFFSTDTTLGTESILGNEMTLGQEIVLDNVQVLSQDTAVTTTEDITAAAGKTITLAAGSKITNDITLAKNTITETSIKVTEALIKYNSDPIEADGKKYSLGMTIPAGTTLTNGMKIPAGEAVPVSTTTTTVSKGTVMAAGTTIPAGSTLPKGTTLPANSKLNGLIVLEGDIDLAGETILPAGTIISQPIMVNGKALSVNGDPDATVGKLTTDITVPKNTVLPAGTMIASTSNKLATFPAGTLNPAVLGKISDQDIRYEIGVGNNIEVNTLGVPELMKDIESDINKILLAINGNADAGIDPATDEELSELFTSMLDNIDQRLSRTSELTAEVGSRVTRLEYTASRLTEDKLNFTELLSQTEEVDIEEVYVKFNQQYAVYQSALQATSMVILNTLADFLS